MHMKCNIRFSYIHNWHHHSSFPHTSSITYSTVTVGIAHLAQWQAVDGIAKKSRFSSGMRLSLLHTIQTQRPTHPPTQWALGGSFPGDKCSQGMKLITHLHLVLRSRMLKRHHSPICLHGMVLNRWSAGTLPFTLYVVYKYYVFCSNTGLWFQWLLMGQHYTNLSCLYI
jgi:hypothetical protein